MKVTSQGVITHYQDLGHASDKSVLVMLHGWGCDWQVWSPVIPTLSERFRLVIPDLPAFGESATPDAIWDSHTYREWLADFIAQVLGPSTGFSLLGHSFGGKVAALYTAHHKRVPEKLLLMDASGLPVPLTAKEQLIQSLSAVLPEYIKNKITNNFKSQLLQTIGVAADYQQANHYQQAVLKKIVRENIAAELKKIAVETHVLWGAHDQATPLSKGKEFAQLIPQAQLHIFAHSGHYPLVDETAAFLDTINQIYDD